jgi:modulator of FtsH protease HflK
MAVGLSSPAESRSSDAGHRRVPRRSGALADSERAQNEAQTYANRVIPEARGRAAQITQSAEAYREQPVAEAKGQAARFIKIYDEYRKAPEIMRERLYLETMERVLGGTDKIILDSTGSASGGVVFYISLNELMKLGNPSGQQPSHPQRTQAGVNR